MSYIKSGTPLDRIIDACDPFGLRNDDAALCVACVVGALLAGRDLFYSNSPITGCIDHLVFGPQNTGKSKLFDTLEAVADALDVPCILDTPKSGAMALEMLHEAIQSCEKGDDGECRFRTEHPRVLWLMDELAATAAAQGGGDAAAQLIHGVQVAINRAADGKVGNSRAVTRRTATKWPNLKGVTVVFVRSGQIRNGAAFLAASRAVATGAERRQAVWLLRNNPPRDAQGKPLAPGVEFWNEQQHIYDQCFDVPRIVATVAELFGDRMRRAIKADLEGVPQRTVVTQPQDPAIHAAIEAAAHGDPVWVSALDPRQHNPEEVSPGQAANALARYWGGVCACARPGANATGNDDWRWGAAIMEHIHTNAERILSKEDSETRQQAAREEVERHFALTPYVDGGKDPRSADSFRAVRDWVGRSAVRQWAFWEYALPNLTLATGRTSNRTAPHFYRRKTPAPWVTDVPKDNYWDSLKKAITAVQAALDRVAAGAPVEDPFSDPDPLNRPAP